MHYCFFIILFLTCIVLLFTFAGNEGVMEEWNVALNGNIISIPTYCLLSVCVSFLLSFLAYGIIFKV